MFLIPKCLSDPVIEIKDESVNEVIDEVVDALVNNIENTTFQIINENYENYENIESITDKKLSIVKKMLNNIIDIIDNQDDKDFDNYEDDEDDDEDDEDEDEDDEDEDEEDDEDDDEDDEDDEDDDDEEKLYIISINDEPCFYENSLKSAKSKILRISNVLDRKNNKEYTSYICHSNTNKIDVIRNLNFILFSYNYILYSLKISSVTKCKL